MGTITHVVTITSRGRRGIAADEHPFDRVAVDRDDLDQHAVDRDHVTLFGDPFEALQYEPRDRVVLAVGEIEAGRALDLVGSHGRRDRPHAVLDLDLFADLARVVLVLDLTDELFDDVLERDDACWCAVLVDHERHLGRVIAQHAEHDVEPGGFRHGDEFVVHRRDRGRLVCAAGNTEEIFRVDYALDLAVGVDDREPGVRGRHQIAERGARLGAFDRDHTVPRHHRVGSLEVAEVDRPLEQRRLRRREVPALGRRVDDQVEFLGRDRSAQLLDRFDADEPQESVRRTVEEADDRAGDLEVEPGRRSDRPRDRLRLCDGEVLRGELAEHHLRPGRQHERDEQGDAAGGRLGDPERVEQRIDHAG